MKKLICIIIFCNAIAANRSNAETIYNYLDSTQHRIHLSTDQALSWTLSLNNVNVISLAVYGLHVFAVNIQNYPNPFNPATMIKFEVPTLPLIKGAGGMDVRLTIYDLLGREVATLVNEQLKPGTYEVEWNTSAYYSGVYFYKLQTESFTQTRKMLLL